jgi:hypothetical protein
MYVYQISMHLLASIRPFTLDIKSNPFSFQAHIPLKFDRCTNYAKLNFTKKRDHLDEGVRGAQATISPRFYKTVNVTISKINLRSHVSLSHSPNPSFRLR